jgi:hypothetical protein
MPLKIFFLLHIALVAFAYSMETICAPNFKVIGLNEDFGKSSAETLQNKMSMQADARQLILPLEESYVSATNNINKQISWAKSRNCSYLLQTTLKKFDKNIQASVRVMSLETGDWVFENAYEAKTADHLPAVFAQLGNALQHPEFIEAEAETENLTQAKSKNQFGSSISFLSSNNIVYIYDSRLLFLWDMKTLWTEIFFSVKMNVKDRNLFYYYEPGIRILYPFSDKPNTFYIGSGGGGSWRADSNSYDAFVESSLGYYVTVKNSSIRVEAVASTMLFDKKSMGLGVRMITGFYTDVAKEKQVKKVEKVDEVKTDDKIIDDEKTRFRARFAYNKFSYYLPNSEGKMGLSGGMVANVPISKKMAFEPGLILAAKAIAIHKAIYYDNGSNYYYDSNLDEFTLSFPVLFKIMPFGGPYFYMEGGVQLDFPSATFEGGESLDSRAAFDFGLAYGFGWNISKNYSFGFRGISGLTYPDKDKAGDKTNQLEVGVYGALGFIPVLLLAIVGK